jgi:hypothetical protein
MNLNEEIKKQASQRLSYYYQEKYIREYTGNNFEETEIWLEYYTSDDYTYHLTYLIETWKNDMIDNFHNAMDYTFPFKFENDCDDKTDDKIQEWKNNYDGTFDYIGRCYVAGYYYTEFNYQWIYDIFELNILGTILK